jgi:hypothetical protein
MSSLKSMGFEKIHDNRPKIAVSFSGGRTSAVMTKLILDKYKEDYNIVVVFANTGCEHEETLKFVKNCDDWWSFGTVWLEAVVSHKKGLGIRHKIVNFESAARNGEPFESIIKKYGIPNQSRPNCTRDLKKGVCDSYFKSIGFLRGKKLNFKTAIGIRADEIDRVSDNAKENGYIYPLVEAGITKEMVINYMSKFHFDLKTPPNLGNCVWCWKKSFRVLGSISLENPEAFDFPKRMEKKYGYKAPLTDVFCGREDGLITFFRNNCSVDDIFEKAKDPKFKTAADYKNQSPKHFTFDFDETLFDVDLDKMSSCSESCEAF